MKKMVIAVMVVAGFGLVGWQVRQGLQVTDPLADMLQIAVDEKAEIPLQLAQAELGTPAVTPALWVKDTDIVLGDANAPVTLIEYSSMTCGHCGNFHNNFLPEIEKSYIANGQVKYIMRDLPWDNMAFGLAKVTRCAPQSQYHMLLQAFYRTQGRWIRSNEPLAEIKKIALMAGMDGATVDQCIKDPDLHEQILAVKDEARKVLKVDGTPTFFINGERMVGLRSFAEIKEAIEAAIKQAQKRG